MAPTGKSAVFVQGCPALPIIVAQYAAACSAAGARKSGGWHELLRTESGLKVLGFVWFRASIEFRGLKFILGFRGEGL